MSFDRRFVLTAGTNPGTEDLEKPPKKEFSEIQKERIDRFVDIGLDSDLFKSSSLNNLKPFYNGPKLDSRMVEIRKSIVYIRQHWEEYDTFMSALNKLLMSEGDLMFKDVNAREFAETMLSSKKDWLDEEKAQNQALRYDAIRLYTSEEGQKKMYRIGNDIFRAEDSVDLVEMIRSVVFLVELINIDLYHLYLRRPEKQNFEGTVYRGLCLDVEDFESFISLSKEPVTKRNIGIPLGLMSASSSEEVAKKFIKITLNKLKDRPDGENKEPFIIKTHVIGLKPEYFQLYCRLFPSTVLTTICAVDIHDISLYPEEQEILLRGPFFHILDLHKEKLDVPAGESYVLETVMLNANRDHISTSQVSAEVGAKARSLFGTMVAVTRWEFAADFCRNRGLLDDAEEYQKMFAENLSKLDSLLKDMGGEVFENYYKMF